MWWLTSLVVDFVKSSTSLGRLVWTVLHYVIDDSTDMFIPKLIAKTALKFV